MAKAAMSMDKFCDGSAGGDPLSGSRLQAYAARSLHLLRDIEQTLIALDTETTVLDAYEHDAVRLLQRLESSQGLGVLDAEGQISRLFRQAAETAERVHTDALTRRAAAEFDPRLTHEDGIVEAFDAYLDALSRYHHALECLREHVETHDALLSPRGTRVFGADEDMIAEILAGR